MVTFSVQPGALDGYAAQMGRAGDDATSIKDYLLGYKVDSGWDGLLIEAVGDSHVRPVLRDRDQTAMAFQRARHERDGRPGFTDVGPRTD